jgi:hypothetical protein
MAGSLSHNLKHILVMNTFFSQALNQTITRALRGHTDAI